MPGFTEVNQDLARIAQELETKGAELEAAREAYLLKKAEYENAFAAEMLHSKLANPEMTQTDIKAKATTATHKLHLDLVIAECAYKRLSNQIRNMRDRLEALREVSFNLRKEASL